MFHVEHSWKGMKMEKQNNQKPRAVRDDPPHRALRRASMTGQAPHAGEKQLPKRMPPQQQERVKKKIPAQRRFRPVRCICAVLLCLILFAFVGYSALTLSTYRRMQRLDAEIGTEGDSLEGCENYLIIGMNETDDLPDWLAILTLNSKQKRYFVNMIHPELYVSIPDNTIGSLSDAYRFGGAAMLCKTVSVNLELKIDGMVSISSFGREKIAEICGVRPQKRGEIGLTECFSYMSDEADAIAAVIKALNPPGIREVLAFRSDVAGALSTTVSAATFYGWSLIKPLQLHGWQCAVGCIPADGTFDIEQRADGADVLAVDLARNIELLKRFLTE